ncbi:MAG: hypothetical protein IJB07_06425 [Firmicutes bacterium]|nr:hypothetical protein [Bacillota bacterium]
MKKRVLFYGDSNTWGFIPANGNRFAEDIRWPSVVGTMLSDHIVAVEDAISGRITNLDKSSAKRLPLAGIKPQVLESP